MNEEFEAYLHDKPRAFDLDPDLFFDDYTKAADDRKDNKDNSEV